MTQPFPEHDFLTGYSAPSGIECDAPDLIIEGELPADLQGVYFRNGPDPLYPPREGQEYHWFHGDGMIQGPTKNTMCVFKPSALINASSQ